MKAVVAVNNTSPVRVVETSITRSALSCRDNEALSKECKEDDALLKPSNEVMLPPAEVGRRTSAHPPRPAKVPQSYEASKLSPSSSTKHTIASMGLNEPASPRRSKMMAPDPEQAVFEQKLCLDKDGIPIKKINHTGKSNLRRVRCVSTEEHDRSTRSCSSRSGSSLIEVKSRTENKRVLMWGKQKETRIALDRFVAVKKGKTTVRAKRCSAPANRIVSLVTDDAIHLDLEAPTKEDRDKFAMAFSKFLQVPLYEQGETKPSESSPWKAGIVAKQADSPRSKQAEEPQHSQQQPQHLPPRPPSPLVREPSDVGQKTSHHSSSHLSSTHRESSPIISVAEDQLQDIDSAADGSDVSSITGHGYDQELVEELHHALNELRTELEESRAEAARAVKVAEQAIQSAERSNSAEWQNTVTHKAAEAAAQAQKKCAEALAKQRLAEERLDGERKTANFWRKQAEVAEEEAGVLQTRAAAAEVQRAAVHAQLESERRTVAAQLVGLRARLTTSDDSHHDALEGALERNRLLELELDRTRREAVEQSASVVVEEDKTRNGLRKKLGRKSRPDSKKLLSGKSSSAASVETSETAKMDAPSTELVMKLRAEALQVRQHFELLRRSTADELHQLPQVTKQWTSQVLEALQTSQEEAGRLREQLAFETASRRKLLHEVQDLRGRVRVYCRPMLLSKSTSKPLLSLASQEIVVLDRDRISAEDGSGPLSFEFDRVFQPGLSQHDVYTEFEEVCLGVLEGYNICIMTYGQQGRGKTHTLLGDVVHSEAKVEIKNFGIQLKATEQLFSIAEHRSDRYKDVFSLTMVEVHNDRLSDLLAGTTQGEANGDLVVAPEKSNVGRRRSQRSSEDGSSSGRQLKLEIRTDLHGETIVQGLVSVDVNSFDEVLNLWQEVLLKRRQRVLEQGTELAQYEASSHVIATLKVVSANVTTGIGSVGKIQFVDLASSDVLSSQPAGSKPTSSPSKSVSGSYSGEGSDVKLVNRSLETLNEVVMARSQFNRAVPYRNSTLTHLLRDSLEHDTKVVVIACVSSDVSDGANTAATLRFASRMGRINIGKATKHTLSPP